MEHNILLTGASGYIGGTILARWKAANLETHGKLYALVRTDDHAEAVKTYDAEPLRFDAYDNIAVRDIVMEKDVSIVIHNIDAFRSTTAINFIEALAEVKTKLGTNVHFLHSSGAKLFSSHAGAPQDGEWPDDSQTFTKSRRLRRLAVDTNVEIVDIAMARGVDSYIVVPCIVYGRGEGFGNPISKQTKAIVQTGKALGQVKRITLGGPRWPVAHISDTAEMYLSIVRAILEGRDIDHDQHGYYLAASGNVAWEDLYRAMAVALQKQGQIDSATIVNATETDIQIMATALNSPAELVELQIGGNCTFTAVHGASIDWKAQYPASHAIETAEDEVGRILAHISDNSVNAANHSQLTG